MMRARAIAVLLVASGCVEATSTDSKAPVDHTEFEALLRDGDIVVLDESLQRERQESIQNCMRENGFEYHTDALSRDVRAAIDPDAYMDISVAKKWGFGESTTVFPGPQVPSGIIGHEEEQLLGASAATHNEDYRASLSDAATAAYDSTTQMCAESTSDTPLNRLLLVLRQEYADLNTRIEADPETLRYLDVARACVKERFPSFSTLDQELLQIQQSIRVVNSSSTYTRDGISFPPDATDLLIQTQQREIAVATAAVECGLLGPDRIQHRASVKSKHVDAFMADNEATIVEILGRP